MGRRVLGCRWHMGAVMGTVLPRAVLRQGGGDVTRTLLAQLSCPLAGARDVLGVWSWLQAGESWWIKVF